MTAMKAWREQERVRLRYSDAQYARPELAWGQSSFIQPQMMVEDRYFYDPVARRYTVDRYLADLNERYGGIDSVLIWPVYPNIGIDSRSQHDLLHDLPGGLDGVRRGVIVSPKGRWRRLSGGQSVNALTTDGLGDLAGQSTFHSTRVWVRSEGSH